MPVQVLQGDARQVLDLLADKSVDCVVTDPPYGETSLAWDIRVSGWLPEIRRVLAPHGSMWVFGSMKMFLAHAIDLDGWRIAQDVVWEKHNGSNPLVDRFRRVHEHAIQLYPAEIPWADIYKKPLFTNDATARTVRRKKKPPQWGAIDESHYVSHDGGPRLMRSVMFVRSCHGSAVHPTQKPVEVALPLIEYSCPLGGVVLDPFAGSGSFGVAAKQLQRNAILIELDPAFVRIAKERTA